MGAIFVIFISAQQHRIWLPLPASLHFAKLKCTNSFKKNSIIPINLFPNTTDTNTLDTVLYTLSLHKDPWTTQASPILNPLLWWSEGFNLKAAASENCGCKPIEKKPASSLQIIIYGRGVLIRILDSCFQGWLAANASQNKSQQKTLCRWGWRINQAQLELRVV